MSDIPFGISGVALAQREKILVARGSGLKDRTSIVPRLAFDDNGILGIGRLTLSVSGSGDTGSSGSRLLGTGRVGSRVSFQLSFLWAAGILHSLLFFD
jgi:hypothetical protein